MEKLELQKKIKMSWWKKSNNLFSNVRRKNVIIKNENNYFRFNFKKATSLCKLYLLPKIHKGLCNVPGRPFIFNCREPAKKFQIFLITIYSL